MIKRLFDLFFSLIWVIVLSPLLLIIAILIKISSPGTVFYRGLRAGKDFKPFKIFKFRTMKAEAEKLGGPSTAGDDPRLTRIGKFLKKWKIDELPQLLNVIKGEISLVGPRPEVLEYAKLYQGEEKIVYTIKPGITDFASLWDVHEEEILKGSPDPEKTYLEKIRPEKVKLQMKYVKEMSLYTDIKIIWRTFLKLIK